MLKNGESRSVYNGQGLQRILQDANTMTESEFIITPHENEGGTRPDWGNDELTKFLDITRNNQRATYQKKGELVDRLIAIDHLFHTTIKDWTNPQNQVCASLFIRCHSAIRAAMGLAMAGQAAECFPLCRVALESAAYAAHIHNNEELGVVWLNRHKNNTSKQEQRNLFNPAAVVASVKKSNQHAAERFQKLYQRTIDFGAHPNEMAVTTNLKITKGEGKTEFLSIYAHGDGVPLEHALKTAAESGLVALEILQIVFKARFELLGVNAELLKIRRST